MNTYMKSTLAVVVLLLSNFVLGGTASAHRSPENCSGSGLQVSLYADVTQVHVGDTISYSLSVYNGLGGDPIVCDATEITASVITPDKISHPITLVRTSLTNGQSDYYTKIVTYIARSEDVKSDNTLTATAEDSGNIHQNDTNSVGGGNQGVNTSVIITPPVEPPVEPPVVPVTVVTPPSVPSGSSSGGSCAYGFNFSLFRCNYTPVVTPAPVIVTQNYPTITTVPPTQFPNAGFGPDEKSFPWKMLVFASILFMIGATVKTYTYVVSKE